MICAVQLTSKIIIHIQSCSILRSCPNIPAKPVEKKMQKNRPTGEMVTTKAEKKADLQRLHLNIS